MQKTKLEDLNLLDDFMFGTMLSHPKFGPIFGRKILQVILNRDIGDIKITPQKVFFGANTDKHGIRLDVFIEENDHSGGTIYDIEPDKNDKPELITALPKRIRFYHAQIDAHSLESGADYGRLKQVVTIMITPYDPFHSGRMIYTIKNCCVEDPDIPYDDGAVTIFLYTKERKGNPPRDLQKLLHYIEESQEKNAEDAFLREIHQMVQKVKHDKEVSLEFMKIFEREKMIHDEGVAEGAVVESIRVIRKLQGKQMSASDISDILDKSESQIEQILELIHANPDSTDTELAEKYLSKPQVRSF